MPDYLAVDVETANADCASICQIGLVEFDETGPLSSWDSLVNPEEPFDGVKVSIHGITEADVADAPKFSDVYDRLREAMTGQIMVLSYALRSGRVSQRLRQVSPSAHRLPLAGQCARDAAHVAELRRPDTDLHPSRSDSESPSITMSPRRTPERRA